MGYREKAEITSQTEIEIVDLPPLIPYPERCYFCGSSNLMPEACPYKAVCALREHVHWRCQYCRRAGESEPWAVTQKRSARRTFRVIRTALALIALIVWGFVWLTLGLHGCGSARPAPCPPSETETATADAGLPPFREW